jgi:hypothetical protein
MVGPSMVRSGRRRTAHATTQQRLSIVGYVAARCCAAIAHSEQPCEESYTSPQGRQEELTWAISEELPAGLSRPASGRLLTIVSACAYHSLVRDPGRF